MKFFISLMCGGLLVTGAACTKPTIKLPDRLPRPEVSQYLSEHLLKPGFGGKMFCTYKEITTRGDQLYAWYLCQEYYREGFGIKEGTGGSGPVALTVTKSPDAWTVTKHATPGNGSQYASDIKRMFPANIQDQMLKGVTVPNAKNAFEARKFFNIN